MAVYNEVQVGRYVRFLQKFLGIKGRQPAPLSFSGELGAIWSMFHGVENRYLEGWNEFWTSSLQGALAAANSAVRMRNPGNSAVIAVFEALLIDNSNGATIEVLVQQGATATDLTTTNLLTGTRRDARGNPTPVLINSTTNTAAALGAGNRVVVDIPATNSVEIITFENQEIALLPGDALQVVTNTVNVALNANFMWRERILEDGERT